MDLDRHTERSLDTALLADALVRCASTALGERALRALRPLPDAAAARAMYAAVQEWWALVDARRAPQLAGARDITPLLVGARKGEVLDAPALIAVGQTLEALDHTARRLLDDDEAPELATLAGQIRFDPALLDDLAASFEPDGRLSARRYPELADLRERVAQLHGTLRTTLDAMARGADDLADDLQDTFWTMRNDRYVLPLKPHARARGVVHGTSGSGKTLFVEPHEILDLNNRLRIAEGALDSAERRILATLSRAVGADAEPLLASLDALTAIDAIAARAELARRLDARPVHIGEQATVQLRDARHPILTLRGVAVIGHDLALSAARPALVLTGPNTGGKTIALKTLGLCAWMVRHGLPLPVAEGGRFDWFDDVLADVGDAQTVEDDLSSFSAQLVAVREMLGRAGPRCLLLLDELASGTDPQQGAALAIAVLEELVARGARVVTTTHYPPLKGLAAADPRFGVAAMEVRDGRPTYRLIADTTGESHALATAARLGLGDQVLARATALWRDQDRGVAQTLEALETRRQQLAATERELAERLASVQALEAQLAARNAHLQEGRRALEAEAAEAYRDRLARAERAIGAVVAQLQAAPSHRAVTAARASLDALRDLAEPHEDAPHAVDPAEEAPRFRVGDRVRHRTLGRGTVEAVGRQLRVRAGAALFTAAAEDLEPIDDAPAAPRTKPRARAKLPKPAPPAPVDPAQALRLPHNTIDLRGMRVDEAIDAVDRGLDRALTGGLPVVFVLHGHGTGALKGAVREALGAHPVVARHMPANADQGGDAYTVVALRA